MDIDYLEEIKIETRPRIRRVRNGRTASSGRARNIRSNRITLESVRNKKNLIESLRQKGNSEDNELGLSASNIESLKKQIEEDRKSRPSRLIATSQSNQLANDLPESKETVSDEAESLPLAVPITESNALPNASSLVIELPSSDITSAESDTDNIQPVQIQPAKGNTVEQTESETILSSPALQTVSSEQDEKEKTALFSLFIKLFSKNKTLGNAVLLHYLVKELFLYFAICFAFFFVVFFVNQILLLAETVLRQRVPVHNVIKLIIYSLPGIIAQSAPFATLVGFLMCVGRMATDNEILIMRASGLRYSYIAVPVVLMGLLISFAGFAMNDYFLPLGILKYNRLRKQIVQSDPAVEIEANSVKRMNGTTLVIGDVNEDGTIGNLVIFDKDSTDRDRVIITGKSEVAKSNEPGILMQFNMSGSTVLEVDRMHRGNFDVFESQRILLNVFDSVLMPNEGIQPREMTSYDLWKIIRVMKKDPSVTHKMMNRYNLEFAKKFSLPFGSIFFALLAFPLALIFGKRDGQTLGMIFGIIISVIYWAATILGQMFGVRSGWNGFWMMWGPNFFIGLIGLLLYLALRKK